MNDRDTNLLANFEKGIAPPDGFHHRDHILVAFLYLQQYPAAEALARFAAALKNFARANNKPHLYHETITWTYIALIHERMARAATRQSRTEVVGPDSRRAASEEPEQAPRAIDIRQSQHAPGADSDLYPSATHASREHEMKPKAADPVNWESFESQNPDLFAPQNAAVTRLYRPETLSSDFAKRVFVLPDLGNLGT